MKIGDLWVKLGLKKEEFSRGMKEAGNESKSLLSIFKGMGGSAKLAFAAVSAAVVGTIAAIKNLAKENQVLGDSIGRFTAGMQGMFETLKTSIASLDFTNLLSRLREARDLARDMYDAQDAMGEIGTSYNIALAQQLKHINELRVALRDANLSDEERIAKGQELLDIYRELEKNPTRGLNNVQNATLDYYMSQVGVNMKDRTDEQLAAMRSKFVEFFKWLGTSQGQATLAAAEKVNKAGVDKGYFKDLYMKNANKAGFGEYAQLALGYSAKMGDDDRLKVEQAVVGYLKQEAHYSEETRRIQQEINSIKAQGAGGSGGGGGGGNPELDAANKVLQRSENAAKSELQILSEKYDQERALLEKYGLDTENLWNEYADNIKKILDTKLSDYTVEIDLELGELNMDEIDEELQQYIDGLLQEMEAAQEVVDNFAEAVVGGFSDAVQELFNQFMGLEEVNPGQIVSALLTPLADMAVKAGEVIMAEGVAIQAAKTSLSTFQGAGSIAAGALLIAAGAAAKAGLSALAKSGGKSTSASTYTGSTGNPTGTKDFQTELTVNVKGTIKGSDIVLSGQRTTNNWNR